MKPTVGQQRQDLVKGEGAEKKMGKKDDVMVDCDTYDDGSGDRAECCGIRQQAEHFKCSHHT
ncbi:hypothetical protein LINPERHAP2_LOCUS42290 [Linum perenne]